MEALKNSILERVAAFPGHTSIYFKDLTTGEHFGYNEQEPMCAASVIKLTVMGVAISSSLQITLYKGSDKAQVIIMPNFNSHRITLSGRLLPKDGSFVVKGRSI